MYEEVSAVKAEYLFRTKHKTFVVLDKEMDLKIAADLILSVFGDALLPALNYEIRHRKRVEKADRRKAERRAKRELICIK